MKKPTHGGKVDENEKAIIFYFRVGTTAVKDGAFKLEDWYYMLGDKYMP